MAFSPRRSSSAWLLLSLAWWHASWSTGRTADDEKLAAASGTRPRIAGLTGQGQAWLPGAPDDYARMCDAWEPDGLAYRSSSYECSRKTAKLRSSRSPAACRMALCTTSKSDG